MTFERWDLPLTNPCPVAGGNGSMQQCTEYNLPLQVLIAYLKETRDILKEK